MAQKAPHDVAQGTALRGLTAEIDRNDVDRAYNGGNAQLRARMGANSAPPAPYTGTVPLAPRTSGGATGLLTIRDGLIVGVIPPT